ncbi:ROK family protein [Glutamicibacter sp. NPDC127525]|uniref:ROK family protein n=1 Tax=unclassified Glutamicibacter TaxID=2627139 RepID=UPI00362A6BA2
MLKRYLLFDVGGTDVKAGLATEEGEILRVLREPTRKASPQLAAQVLVDQLLGLAAKLREANDQQPAAAGLVVCGLVDPVAEMAVFSANLGWRDVPMKRLVSDALGLPVGFGHDVASAARAELELGSGAHYDALRRNSAILIIGTGIASALVVDGRLLEAGGYAGELGHAPVPGGLLCACGATGCLETLASAGAIARRYEQATGTSAGAKEIFAARAAGDAKAATIIAEAIEALSFTLAQLCSSTAPEGIIIGGGLAQAGPSFFAEIEQSLERRLSFQRRPRIVPARLGAEAGLQGALLLARQSTRPGAGRHP